MVIISNHFRWVSYDKTPIPTIDEEGEIGVRKKQYVATPLWG
jgi:hypothetical protein